MLNKLLSMLVSKNIKSRRDALAAHLSLDLADVNYYRYHTGHTSIPVYAFTEAYYCVTRGSEKPAKHRDGIEWKWVEVPDNYINQDGYKIWKAGTEIN